MSQTPSPVEVIVQATPEGMRLLRGVAGQIRASDILAFAAEQLSQRAKEMADGQIQDAVYGRGSTTFMVTVRLL